MSTAPEIMSRDMERHVQEVWEALEGFRDDCIPEGDDAHDRQWADICESMAIIREELGLKDEVNL